MAITATGYRNRLLEEAPALGIQVSKKQAEKIGIRIARRIESQMVELDFYEALRIMGIISDPTARDAVRNMEAAA
ncbi:hypothetical protein ACLQ8T_05610 [Glutamicibacter sp. FR1]|uniref:hypothetical protein n=1 Tax=Glutamicibacter sp. FR1 TaxID=3393744 RepID=UPI0039B11A48